ncbi:MAG: sugar ABC transporter substrate-binding protein [Clostridiales bacterium]|nr:sugar ABC transporter substrate-binding protein [Clostridiales bacterium]
MKNLRKLLALVLALAMCFALAACGSTSSSSDDDSDTSTAAADTTTDSSAEEASDSSTEEVTITWALWDYDSTAYWSALKEEYEATHEGVTIEYIDLGSTDYMTQLATQLAGGNSELDVVSIKDIPGYSNLINLGLLEPMNDYLTTDEEDFNGVLEQLTADDGNYYAIPFRSDFWVLFYNKDIFDAAGIDYPSNDLTMEEYDALARELTSGEGSDKIYGTHYHTWRSDVTLFGILDGENTIIDGTYDFLYDYYELVLAEQEDGICMDYGELKTSGLHYSAAFENGQVAMCPMGSWFIATLQTYNAEAEENGVDEVNFGFVKYPHPEGVEAGTTLGTVTSLAVNTNSENKDAAIDFVNWCASSEGAAVMASTGSFPAITTEESNSIIAATDGFPTDENSLEAMNTVAVYLEMPLSSYASEIETILNTEHDAIMTGSETIEEGIANMNEQVQEILAG